MCIEFLKPECECFLRCLQQNFFQASKYIPDICVIRAVQKIVWASGCGTVQLVFSSNEEISKIYEKVCKLVQVGSKVLKLVHVRCIRWC